MPWSRQPFPAAICANGETTSPTRASTWSRSTLGRGLVGKPCALFVILCAAPTDSVRAQDGTELLIGGIDVRLGMSQHEALQRLARLYEVSYFRGERHKANRSGAAGRRKCGTSDGSALGYRLSGAAAGSRSMLPARTLN